MIGKNMQEIIFNHQIEVDLSYTLMSQIKTEQNPSADGDNEMEFKALGSSS